MKGVISIGANVGQEFEQWVNEGYENFMFFEPVQSTYMKLHQIMSHRTDYNITLYNLAIGNTEGEITMNTETSHQGKSCSILNPKLHLHHYPDIIFDKTELVKINKLDNIIYNRENYDFLHIDTQGYELEVLKGAIDSLTFIEKIQVEVYRAELYKGCPRMLDVTDFLWEKGFEVMEVKWLGLAWGDCYLRRRK